MLSHVRRCLIAGAMALLLVAGGLPPTAYAAGAYKLTGKILAPDGVTPVAGAVVIFKERASGLTYTSEPTDTDGTYRISGLAEGDYFLTIKAEAGVFELSKEIAIRGGQPTTLTVVLTGQPAARGEQGPATPKKKSRKWTAVVLSAVGGAVVIGLAAAGGDGDDEEGSRYRP